ncbi:hypothetical protein GWK47_049058 [Chionoecetes opilio]|uniref:Uncharacterized protein n=1 Tax=Chionoecetes opilio TaxID=41210 RepID=A0A8J4Y2G4_CHIOP|nr:hypothetical protein GWK47_049058 [Chionoecetes opilio]
MAVSKELEDAKLTSQNLHLQSRDKRHADLLLDLLQKSFLIGYPSSSISGSQLPTNRQAFPVLLHLQSLPENTGNPKHQDLANETVEAIIPFWQMARIKTMTKYNAAQAFHDTSTKSTEI